MIKLQRVKTGVAAGEPAQEHPPTSDDTNDVPDQSLCPPGATHLPLGPGTVGVHVQPDPLTWADIPPRISRRREVDPQEWAASTAARFLDGIDHSERHEPFLRARLLELWRTRLEQPTTRSFVHHSDLRLATLDISVRPGARDEHERHRALVPPGPPALFTEFDYHAHKDLGEAQKVMRFSRPGPTELGINATGTLTLLWRLDEASDLRLDLNTRCAERLLRLLPDLDALLQTLTRCSLPVRVS